MSFVILVRGVLMLKAGFEVNLLIVLLNCEISERRVPRFIYHFGANTKKAEVSSVITINVAQQF